MNIEVLNELLNSLKEKVKIAFGNNNVIELQHSYLMDKTHIDVDGFSYEKYYGKDKQGYSISYTYDDTFKQVLVFKNGSIIIVDDKEIKSFSLKMIKDEEIDYLIGQIQVLLNRINSRVNKHK